MGKGNESCSGYLGHMTKMAAILVYIYIYMVKPLQKYSSPESVDRFPRNLVCYIGDSGPS